jgi:hypothetical protein
MTNTIPTPMPPVPADLGRIELGPCPLEVGELGELDTPAELQDIDIAAIIKDVGSSVDTDDQWVDLGLACLDQAGVSLRDQDRIMAILQGAGQ